MARLFTLPRDAIASPRLRRRVGPRIELNANTPGLSGQPARASTHRRNAPTKIAKEKFTMILNLKSNLHWLK
jgi:hypothetical protein